MYNQFQKEEYLSEISNFNSQKSIQRVFNASESLENYRQKDICDFSKEELIDFFAQKTGTNDIASDKSILKAYVSWCIYNNKSASAINSVDRIHSYDIDKRTLFQKKYLLNESELNEMLDIVYGDISNDEKTICASKELIIRLCYLGLENEEIVQLKKEMVDYENNTISSAITPEYKYPASKKILELCKYCSVQTEHIYTRKNDQIFHEDICDNDYVIRRRIGTVKNGNYSDPLRSEHVHRKVKEFCQEYEQKSGIHKELTPDKIRESSLFHLIHNAVDKDSFLNNELKSILLLKNPLQGKRNLYEKLRRTKQTYEIWLKAFEYPEFQFQQAICGVKKRDIFEEISKIHTEDHIKSTYTKEEYTRNHTLVARLKKEYNFRCQLCKKENYFDIETSDGYYAEIHHIIPNSEGIDEEGSLDRPGNMIVVCPNHHRYLHHNKGGNYRLCAKNGRLYLSNNLDELEIMNDLHLFKYNQFDIQGNSID